MKVLVIGASSALAQHLIPRLAPFAEVLTGGRHACRHIVDLAAPLDTWNFPSGIDTVVNLAAHFGGPDFAGLDAAQAVNARGVLHLVHACEDAGVRHLVHISSIFATLTDTSPYYSAYSLTKRHGEELARQASRNSTLALTLLRPGQLYGPAARFRRLQPFFYTILAQATAGQEIVFQGRHDPLRNFIHVDDVAEVIARCVADRVTGDYACIAQDNLSYGLLARTAIDVLGGPSRIRFDPSQPDIADNGFAADDRLYRHLDYFPRVSLAEGIAGLADELRALKEFP